MREYIDNPEATANTIRDGWIYSGDLGYYDEDGDFFIVDRLKELIKYNAYQVIRISFSKLCFNPSQKYF